MQQLKHTLPLALAVVMALAFGAHCHGGSMHNISTTDTSAKIRAGSCTNWGPVTVSRRGTSPKAKASKLAPPAGRHLLADALDAQGSAIMYVKLGDNCTGDYYTSVVINITLTEGTKPLSNVSINGSVNTGKCSAGGGSVFLLNTTEGDVSHNKVFFKPIDTDSDGRILGSFANDGVVRVSGNGSAESIVLYREGAPILCCDLITSAPAGGFEAALAPAGKPCTAEEEGANQLGMFMDGKWVACTTQVNGSYWMKHGDTYALCNEYRNGTKATTTSSGTNNTNGTTTTGTTKGNSAGAAGQSWFVTLLLLAAAVLAL